MAGSHIFMKARSLRYGSDDCWCDKAGRYRVEMGNLLEGFGTFFFHVRRKNRDGTVITLTCKSYRRSGCRVRAKIRKNGEILHLLGVHDHLPDKDGHSIEYREVRARWIDYIRENPRKNPRDAILQQRRKLPLALASKIVPLEHVRTCRRHAGMVRPPKVHSLSELHEVISTGSFPGFNITQDGQRLVSFFNQEHDSLLLTSETLLESLSEAGTIHAHATYKVVPRKLCAQLLTIHGNRGGRVGIIACAFMNSSYAGAHQWIFRRLKQALPTLNIPAYIDEWDQALRRAVRAEFPDVSVYGCLFHYCQSLVRKVSDKKVGMAEEITKPGEILSNFLALTAIPLLPAALIEPTFVVLEARARDLHVGFPALLTYISSHWLRTVGPQNLSVHGLRQQTNDDIEPCNSKFFRATGSYGSVWSPVSLLVDSAQDVVANKGILSKPGKATGSIGLEIHDSWTLLENGLITAVEFVDRVKYKLGKKTYRRILSILGISVSEDSALREWLERMSSQRYTGEDAPSDSTISASEEDIEAMKESLFESCNQDDDTVDTATASEGDSNDDESSNVAVLPNPVRDHTYTKPLEPSSMSFHYSH